MDQQQQRDMAEEQANQALMREESDPLVKVTLRRMALPGWYETSDGKWTITKQGISWHVRRRSDGFHRVARYLSHAKVIIAQEGNGS